MRIVGGKHAGRDLAQVGDTRMRPTAERVRAAMMDALVADLKGARVLDLFAGTGALGLEAISRGAKYADFVEMNASSLHALKANIGLLRMKDNTRVFKKDALPFADALHEDDYDIVFADPPYESRMLDRLIERWLRDPYSKVLVAEHARTHVLPKGALRRTYDDSAVTIYRKSAPG
jgi:16S rRNA (guanine966-N2)-methyltransferase